MIKRKTQNAKRKTRNRRGAALLVVLFMIMAVVVISLGILYRADMAAAGGHNYALRTQADYIAWAGLEHARALILADSDVPNRNIEKALFSLDYDGDDKDNFVYKLEINNTNPDEYSVTCKVYYHKDAEDSQDGKEPISPRSILYATALYEDSGESDDPRVWFTNIRRSQE